MLNIKPGTVSEQIIMMDAVERYLRGEMLPDELAYFEQLRKSNAEVDQLVVEHNIFLQEMEKVGQRRQIQSLLQQTHHQLASTGEIAEITPGAKVVGFIRKYRRVLAAAACIAGITALAISGLVAYLTPKSNLTDIAQLKKELNAVKISQKQTQKVIDNIHNAPVSPRPTAIGKFGGTGFLIDGRGYLVTSAHVVKNADSIYVVNTRGDYFKAKPLLLNDKTDIAILKIADDRFETFKSIPYSIRRSGVDLGEPIFTLGFPRTEIVYNEGYLSAKTGYEGDTLTFQLAISANPGNSGGPIFNREGDVIGILSGKQTTAEGVVFSSKAKNIYTALDSIRRGNLTTEDIRIANLSGAKGLDRTQQVKKIEDCIFNVMSY